MAETKKILAGLKDACLTYFYMKSEELTKIKPEYLLTTLVAKQFAIKDSEHIVKLEEPTSKFATGCVMRSCKLKGFSGQHNTSRNGKIDIAVYFPETQEGFRPRNKSNFAIELKGVNPGKRGFQKDVERNLEYFYIQDKNTGDSLLNKTFNASIESPRQCLFHENIAKFKRSIYEKYESWLTPYLPILNEKQLEFKISISELLHDLPSVDDGYGLAEGDTFWSYIYSWYLYVGVVVEISRKYKV